MSPSRVVTGFQIRDPMRSWSGATRAAMRCIPGMVAGLVALVCVRFGIPVVGLLAMVVLVAVTPTARTLPTRTVLATAVAMATATIVLMIPGVPWNAQSASALIVMAIAVQVLVTLVNGHIPIRPPVSLAEAIVGVGSLALMTMLALPYLGVGADGVLLDLTRGYDNLNHYMMVSNFISQELAVPVCIDGSYYPLGFHALVAGSVIVAGLGDSGEFIVPFAAGIVLAMGLAAAVLGWMGVWVGEAIGDRRNRVLRGRLIAVGWAGAILLGATFHAPFELGHAPFVLPAALGATISCLALRLAGGSRYVALAVLLLGGAGLAGAYPPLLSGLIPAAVLLLGIPSRRPSPTGWARIFLLSLVVAAVLALSSLRWGDRARQVAQATGEHATSLGVSLVMVTVTGVLAWLAWDAGHGRRPAQALSATAGYLALSVALAIGAAASGLAPGDSYYAAKLAEAAWLSALPVLVALLIANAIGLSARTARGVRFGVLALAVAGVSLIVGVIPEGRHPGSLGGPALLAQRLREAERALGQVKVVEASSLAGRSNGDAAVMVEPSGWFLTVSEDEAYAEQWTKPAVSASQWLNTLRGVRSEDQNRAASCMVDRGTAQAIPCLEGWLDQDLTRRLTVAVMPGSSGLAFAQWAGRNPDRVRIVWVEPPA